MHSLSTPIGALMPSIKYGSMIAGRGVRRSKSAATWSYVTILTGEYTPYKDIYQYGGPALGIPSNTCFRRELLISLRLILGQLSKARLVHHKIAPVLLISLAGRRARLLESYFDEKSKSLMIRSSHLYELNNKKSVSEAFKIFTDYFLGDPAGNTL
ncbi:hypothetical protein N7453_004928 [Penicillium expansum]|nr:hypothetical protein N7453_004928 [Penicillium expansum]